MRISPKLLLKTTARFLRRNKSQILKIASSLAVLAATGIAVKEGIKAKERIDEKEEELRESDPDATLSVKEKAKIVVGTCVPSFMIAILSVVGIHFLYSGLSAEVAAATGAAAYYASRDAPMITSENDEEMKPAIHLTKDMNLDDVKFDVYEPISGALIEDVTVKKLVICEYMTNKIYHEEREMYLDWVVEFLGGDKLPNKDDRFKYIWDSGALQLDGYMNPQAYSNWITFKPCLDGEQVILLFEQPPRDSHRAPDDDDIVKKSYSIYGDRIFKV